MGSGKTTIGELLAQKINYGFLDTDRMIEEKENSSIRDIFENAGEVRFRELENSAIRQTVVSEKKLVVSLGGGSLIRKENLKLVKNHGFLIYLETGLDTVRKRIPADPARPLLKDAPLEKLFSIRRSSYEKADLTVPTDHKTPAEIVEIICSSFQSLP